MLLQAGYKGRHALEVYNGIRVSLALCLPFMAAPFAAVSTFAASTGNDTIRRDQLEADLTFLAGDGMRGRLTGSAEYSSIAEGVFASQCEMPFEVAQNVV